MTPAQEQVLHLTFTGPLAGQPFCGVDKGQALDKGHSFSHVPYTNINRFFEHPHLCQACKAFYESEDE